ncbi:MAG: hypothetical protein ABFS56_02415 [Pseudomonadota bacterium]
MKPVSVFTYAVHVVGLGSGCGEKDCCLLEALHAQKLLFTPVDVSEVLALLSAQRVAHLLEHATFNG